MNRYKLSQDHNEITDTITKTRITNAQEATELLNNQNQQINFWKKWAIEYLINYELYTEESLKQLEAIEGKEKTGKRRKKQEKIRDILINEKLWEEPTK